MEWFEKLPLSCPPSDATDCQGTYYRVSHGNPAESHDFFSQRLLAPDKQFKGEGIDECIVRAVSVFSELDDAKNLLKLPKFKKGKHCSTTFTRTRREDQENVQEIPLFLVEKQIIQCKQC